MFLVAITVIVFWQLKTHEFVNYDDLLYVTQNPHVRAGLSYQGLAWAFSDASTGTWHPLTWLSLMLDREFFGLNPSGFHLTNLFFHILNTLLLFLVFFQMTGARVRSAFVAALFAIHPLHVESVSWVAERKDVLSTFFLLLSTCSYVRYVKKSGSKWYWVTLFLYVLGLLSKPMVVILPFIFLLLDFWPLNRIRKDSKVLRRLFLEKIPFFVLAIASSILTVVTQQAIEAVKTLDRLSAGMRIANAFVSYVRYIEKTICPLNLSFYYPYSKNISYLEISGSILFIFAITVLVLRSVKTRPWLSMGWFWFLGTLVPVIGLVQVGSQAMADRYTYIPLIGLFVMLSWSAPSRWSARWIAVAAGGLLSSLMVMSWVQNRYWQNSFTLMEHALKVNNENPLAHANLGVALASQGKLPEAIDHYREALRIEPNYPEALYDLGLTLAEEGKTEEAITSYAQAIRERPNFAPAYNVLGVALASRGEKSDAIAFYAQALKINPDYLDAHYNLGAVLASQGKIDQAIEQYNEALRIDPLHAEVQNSLGLALASQGKTQEAFSRYNQALKTNPNYVEAHNNIGIYLAAQGHIQEAIDHFTIALKINPNLAETHFNLGVALNDQDKFQEAIDQYREALRINSKLLVAHRNLGHLYQVLGNKNSAIQEYEILRKLNPDMARELFAFMHQGRLSRKRSNLNQKITE